MWVRTSILPAILLASCADYSMRYDEADTDADGAHDTAYGEDDDWDYDTDVDTDTDAPPEQEDDFLALRPAQTDVYVFVANPARDTVTRVNVLTLEVRTTQVGDDPRVVTTTPDYAGAAVFNKGDDTISLIDAATLEARTVGVRDNFNQMVMSPDGEWVAAFHDVAAEEPDDEPPDGLQSYNEVSFVNFASGAHFPMAVGFNPRRIQFTPDGSLAVIVSDEYLALVDLTAEVLSPEMVQVAEDLVEPPPAEEVVIAPDGSYAFVRQFGAEEVLVVDLLTEEVTPVPVGLNPTDLDLSPDGTKAVVVARGSKELYVLDVADPFAPPEILGLPESVSLGSLLFDPTGDQAILYTTATLTDRYATWDVATGDIDLRSLVKPVRSMAVTPTGESLLVFHTRQDAEGADTGSPFYNQWALTLIDLDDFRTNPLRLPAEPTGYANAASGDFGYFIMEGEPYFEVLHYDTLLYTQVELHSDPVYVGVFPDLAAGDGDEPPAWVSQEHDLGRISFWDPDDPGAVETITGFELNSEIED